MPRRYGDISGRDAFNRDLTELFHKVAADGAASTATAETPIFTAAFPTVLKSITIVPGAALTADNTNNAVITFARRDAGGSNKVTIGTLTTNVASGNWVAWTDKVLASLANTTLTAGQHVTMEITKGGTGVAVPISTVRIAHNAV